MAKGGTTGAPVPEDPAARQPVRVRFIRWFDSLGLARKIYLLYALLLVLPLVLITLFLARNAYQDAIRKAMSQGMSVIGQAQIRAEEGLNGCMHAFQLARSNKRFMEVLTTPRSYSTLELLEFKRNSLSNVEAIKDINPDFASLDIYTANPFMYEFFPTVHYLDTVRDEAWYRSLAAAEQGLRYHLGSDGATPSGGMFELAAFLQAPIEAVDGVTAPAIAVFRIRMSAGALFGPAFSAASDPERMLVVVTEAGDIIADRNHPLSPVLKDEANTAILRSMATQEQTPGGDGVVRLGDRQIVVSATDLPTLHARILCLTSLKSVLVEIRGMMVAILMAGVCILAFLTLATFLIVSVFMRKIRTVIGIMRQTEHGVLPMEMPDLGGDEAGELGRHFQDMMLRINELIHTAYRREIAARDAEIRSLNAQINAHFLYNVLETLKMMAVIRYEYGIADAITALGRIMRYSMNWQRHQVTLREEVSNLTSYMTLSNLQREVPVTFRMEIPDHLMGHSVLKMMLQPIAENAMLHGLKTLSQGAVLTVSAWAGDALCLRVSDNGRGMPPDRLAKLRAGMASGEENIRLEGTGNGIGLLNICQRIRIFHGEAYGVTVESTEGAGTDVLVRLPLAPAPSLNGKEGGTP